MATLWTLIVNGESYPPAELSVLGAVREAVEEAFRRGGGWVDVGDAEFFMTPTTQVSLRPQQATRVRL